MSVFGAFLGSLTGGVYTEYLGRKKSMVFGNVLAFCSLLCIWCAKDISLLFVGRFMVGFANGSLNTCIGPYVGELCQPGLRKVTSIFGYAFNSVGFAVFYILGIYFHWRKIIFVFLWWPLLCGILIIFCPESPPWLVSKGKLDESIRCLTRLRKDTLVVNEEYERIVTNAEKQAKQRNLLKEKSVCIARCSTVRQKTFLKPFSLLVVMMTIGLDFTGDPAISYYLVPVLSKLNIPISANITAAIVGSWKVFIAIVCTISASKIPRRRLYTTGCVVSGMGCFLFATINHLETRNNVYQQFEETYLFTKWLPIIPILLINTGAGIVVPVTVTLLGELLPSNVRSFGSGILIAISYISLFVAVKATPFIQQIIGLDGVYFIFFGCNIFVLVVVYINLPETFGLTLEDIEEHYRRLCSTKNTKK